MTIPGFDSTVFFHGSEAINLLSVGEFVGFFGLKLISSFLHLILCPFKLTLEIAVPANLNRAKCDQTSYVITRELPGVALVNISTG